MTIWVRSLRSRTSIGHDISRNRSALFTAHLPCPTRCALQPCCCHLFSESELVLLSNSATWTASTLSTIGLRLNVLPMHPARFEVERHSMLVDLLTSIQLLPVDQGITCANGSIMAVRRQSYCIPLPSPPSSFGVIASSRERF